MKKGGKTQNPSRITVRVDVDVTLEALVVPPALTCHYMTMT